MSLKEKSIELYEKHKELISESNLKEAERFAEDALKALREMLGSECGDIVTLDKQPGVTVFSIDGLLFRVIVGSHGYPNINVLVKCPVCETDVSVEVVYIRDIGRALVEPHFKYDCEKVLRTKKQVTDDKNGVVLGNDERLLSALRDFVAENMGSSI